MSRLPLMQYPDDLRTSRASEQGSTGIRSSSGQGTETKNSSVIQEIEVDGEVKGDGEQATFESLGLCDWVLSACKAMGFRRPTPVQAHCIPAVSGEFVYQG